MLMKRAFQSTQIKLLQRDCSRMIGGWKDVWLWDVCCIQVELVWHHRTGFAKLCPVLLVLSYFFIGLELGGLISISCTNGVCSFGLACISWSDIPRSSPWVDGCILCKKSEFVMIADISCEFMTWGVKEGFDGDVDFSLRCDLCAVHVDWVSGTNHFMSGCLNGVVCSASQDSRDRRDIVCVLCQDLVTMCTMTFPHYFDCQNEGQKGKDNAMHTLNPSKEASKPKFWVVGSRDRHFSRVKHDRMHRC